ncbi:hypothetical protein DYU11_02655 [Fibrisoma montanum]|uniref:Uncharacterized protein n=2 Tax=Fibrisoma montanum TaxID=2305895 RepID=A0A418MII2_9BACT|nr:hypothetical protein DYU11_02655 [Fibrisoma montanum]
MGGVVVDYIQSISNGMKGFLFLSVSLWLGVAMSAMAQSQSPTMQQSTSTTNTRTTSPVKTKMKKSGLGKPMQNDTTQPRNRRQRRLPPDSLRRGGATRVDTVR